MRFLLLVALLIPAVTSAQETSEIQAARAHFQAASSARLSSADLADLRPLAVHSDARTGLTYVTLAQHYGGVEVFETGSTVAVRRGRAVAAAEPAFQTDLARRAGPSDPTVPAATAVATAEALATQAAGRVAPAIPTVYDDPARDGRQARVVFETTEPRLGYHTTRDGSLRLAWEVVVNVVEGPHVLRTVRVDARTGTVLTDDDLIVHEHGGAPSARASAPASAAHAAAPVGGSFMTRAGRYRVIPAPFESPSRSDFVLVADPEDPVASPLGWHNDGSTAYTITRGNNAYAYTDSDGNNIPDPNSAPDGGAELVFDFVFDPDADPAANAPAAVTNLFYWNNITHDVLFRYGFDEAAGNFQQSNPVSGANGAGDPVQAEALDGSGTNNANFSTPPDGQDPRMQMFRWSGTTSLEVTAPENVAGDYQTVAATFGPGGDFSGELVPALGPNGETEACTAAGGVVNDLTGKVALIERGTCNFDEKVANAENAGAIGAVVYNRPNDPAVKDDNGGEALIRMGGDGDPPVNIPSTFVARSTGLSFAANSDVQVEVATVADRDSGLDAGIVVHEYGHGISNRLIAGPQAVGCLRNGATDPTNPANNRPGEQMGEGWSDWYGMMLTQRTGDSGEMPRGVGTYVQFEIPDGPGIRPAPYSTDFSINDFTYVDVVENAGHNPFGPRGLSIPHGVGFAWATMLWDMTWELIDEFGYSEDLLDADGTAGNQIAMNLVTTGLKLTPCSPGFVDGRDAILAADQALYDGAYQNFIWAAFARRGLGVNADQGSASANNDGAADFTAPEPVANEGDVEAGQRLTLVGPNPTRGDAALTLTVESAQTVRVALYDGLGRLVRESSEVVAAGAPQRLAVGSAGLPAGVYVVRVEGESFAESQTLTVVR